MSEQKKLYRVKSNEMISGVCSGLAEYFDTDVSLIRVIFVLVLLFSGGFPLVIAYVVLAIVLPTKEQVVYNKPKEKDNSFVDDSDYTINDEDYRY